MYGDPRHGGTALGSWVDDLTKILDSAGNVVSSVTGNKPPVGTTQYPVVTQPAVQPKLFGMSGTTLLLLSGAAVAAFLLLKKK